MAAHQRSREESESRDQISEGWATPLSFGEANLSHICGQVPVIRISSYFAVAKLNDARAPNLERLVSRREPREVLCLAAAPYPLYGSALALATTWPRAISTMSFASWFGSRGRLGSFATDQCLVTKGSRPIFTSPARTME
jgi:hypothetical protein